MSASQPVAGSSPDEEGGLSRRGQRLWSLDGLQLPLTSIAESELRYHPDEGPIPAELSIWRALQCCAWHGIARRRSGPGSWSWFETEEPLVLSRSGSVFPGLIFPSGERLVREDVLADLRKVCPLDARPVELGVLLDLQPEPFGDLAVAPSWALRAGADAMYQRRFNRPELHRNAPRYWELCAIGPYRPPQNMTGRLLNIRVRKGFSLPIAGSGSYTRRESTAEVSVEWLAANPVICFAGLIVSPQVFEILRPHLQTPFLCTSEVELYDLPEGTSDAQRRARPR